MKKTLQCVLIMVLTFTFASSQSTTYAQSEVITVETKTLNMRSGPGLSFEVITSLKKGDQTKILSTSGDWLQVEYKDQTGYIASWLTASTTEASTNRQVVSQVDHLNVRATPSVGATVLGRMDAGDEAKLIKQDGSWAFVNFNGMNGWVHTDYVSVIDSEQKSVTEETEKSFSVSVDALNIRKKADLSSKKIGTIYKDESYPVKEVVGNWVKISLSKNNEGWVYSFYGTLSAQPVTSETNNSINPNTVTVLTDGTNIRESASTSSNIVVRANAGEQFTVKSEANDWFEISLSSGDSAFIAKWVVSLDNATNEEKTTAKKQPRVKGTLQGLTIVIDPGHGGNDKGTTGARETLEKELTLKTSELLATKLKAAGASVHLTRESDDYVSLRKRVASSHQYDADAFLSIHYDATTDSSVTGFTTYYMYNWQADLANSVNNGLNETLSIRNRGAQPGNYFVLRENRQNAILIELGFLSNPSEELALNSSNFREQATHGIYNGLLSYFNSTISE